MLLAIKYGRKKLVQFIFDNTDYNRDQANYNLLQEMVNPNASIEIIELVTDRI